MPAKAEAGLRDGSWAALARTILRRTTSSWQLSQPWFVPASACSTPCAAMPWPRWRPPALAGCQRLPRATPVEPPVPYPEDTLSYLANVFNHKARDFYAARREGDRRRLRKPRGEGEVSLMITKHCVRYGR
jgi:hypothetical protein